MKKQLTNKTFSCALVLLSSCMLSCVDSDYDLSKDLDMTITVGGDNLTIPASNTKDITLDKIFDLDEESTVKTDAAGNYALIQSGEGSNTQVTIEDITINSNEIALQSARTELNYEVSLDGTLTATVSDKTSFSIDKKNITTDVTALYSSDVIMPASNGLSTTHYYYPKSGSWTDANGSRVNPPSGVKVSPSGTSKSKSSGNVFGTTRRSYSIHG